MDLDDECQSIWFQLYEMIHIVFFGDMSQEVHVFHKKAILFGHLINQGRKIYNGRHASLTKENNLSL